MPVCLPCSHSLGRVRQAGSADRAEENQDQDHNQNQNEWAHKGFLQTRERPVWATGTPLGALVMALDRRPSGGISRYGRRITRNQPRTLHAGYK